MQFTMPFEFILDIGTRNIPNIIGIRTEARQRINAVHYSRSIYVQKAGHV